MHRCDEREADLQIDGIFYRLDSLAEANHMARMRGEMGVSFPDLRFTLKRLEEAHKQELARLRAEKKAE